MPLLKEEIISVLDSFGFNRNLFFESIKKSDPVHTTLETHSSLWYNGKFIIRNKNYPQLINKKFSTTKSKIQKQINQWVNEKTRGLIREIPLNISLELVTSILINVVYLKCHWQNEFPSPDYPGRFTLLNGDSIETGYLSKVDGEEIGYLNKGNFEVIALPYKGKRVQFEIYLPSKDYDFKKLIQEIHQINFKEINKNFTFTKNYILAFPKFEISSQINFEKSLAKNNLSKIFKERVSPYLKEKPLGLSNIFQACNIKVNEKGTEAAAVTYDVAGTGFAPPQEQIEFIADRPFLFAIRDIESDIFLFLGTLTHPPQFTPPKKSWRDYFSWIFPS